MATATGNTFDIIISDGKMMYVPDLSSAQPTIQGQITTYDAALNGGTGGLRAALTQADMNTYAGVAEQNSIMNSLNEQLPTVRVGFKNVYNLMTTPGETYKMGDTVYLNETVTGSTTVTKGTNSGARTKPVGYVILPNQTMMAGQTTVAGASGVTITVAVVANFPIVGIA